MYKKPISISTVIISFYFDAIISPVSIDDGSLLVGHDILNTVSFSEVFVFATNRIIIKFEEAVLVPQALLMAQVLPTGHYV